MHDKTSAPQPPPTPAYTNAPEAWRIRKAASALSVPRQIIETLLKASRPDRVRILTAAATLAEEAMR